MQDLKDISGWYGFDISLIQLKPPFSSFKISRPLKGREQLDFSSMLRSFECGLFLHSYWPRDSPGKGNPRRKQLIANPKQPDALI
jgi:hypothetical protein